MEKNSSQQNRTRAYRKKNDTDKKPVRHKKRTNSKTRVHSKDLGPTLKKAGMRRPPKKKIDRKRNKAQNLPHLNDGDIRIVPVCGVEWIGTNMSFIEYKDEILVIDAGFGFQMQNTPGINYTIPDVTYLEEHKHKIKALVITHGHMDHVGGIPYVIERLGNPPIFTREFGAMFIKSRLEEFKHLPPIDIRVVEEQDDKVQLGDHLSVKFFGLTHSIPDSTGVIIYTPHGGIVSTGDVRVENVDGVPVDEEIEQYKFFQKENILLMTCDSTGIPKPGWSISENAVRDSMDQIIKDAPGRIFIATFSSQVERLIAFLESAKKYNKYVVIEGRSMKNNLGIAKALELTDFSHVIPIGEMQDYPDDKILMVLTGAQGEQYSAMDRISKGSHKYIKIKKNDTVVLSSSVVPGNEYPVGRLKDNLYQKSDRVITYADDSVHASGHGKRDELAWIHRQIPYKFFMPIHGEQHMLYQHAALAKKLGAKDHEIVVPDNGRIIEIRENGRKLVKTKHRIPHDIIVVDGKYIGPLHPVVMQDRETLHEHGMFIIVISLNVRSGTLKKSPDIISRGFVYLRESHDLLNSTRDIARKTTETIAKKSKGKVDFDKIKKDVARNVTRHIRKETGKEPVIIPVLLGV